MSTDVGTKPKKGQKVQKPQRQVIVTENPTDEPDKNDKFSWAHKEGLMTKNKSLIQHAFKKRVVQAQSVPVIAKASTRRKTQGGYEVSVKTNKAQYMNDLNWLRVASPDVFQRRAHESIHELNVFNRRHY